MNEPYNNSSRTETVVIRRLSRTDELSACQVFEQAIRDAFAQEGLADSEDDIAYEISHKSDKLRAALDAAEAGVQEGERFSPGMPAQPFFLIADLEGETVGTISFGPCGDLIRELSEGRLNGVGELGSLYIRPDLQGLGIGSKLIAGMMQELRARGIESFCLDSGYGRAQKRWRRKFGEPYAWAENYWGPGMPHAIWYCRVEDAK
ncbi:GNAT family N-acetyltransferase [Saccharibacillus sp. O23]|uniref:GNAT family N-acetyltransferase n=1 Tax=Saccharibacillus sp. O23 TaxID=2009338 RepID=UPI000B4E4D8A|nr:GNAT family N-acetyltransferase [Saccharibacillus sp. O23]OWR32123.1 GNAT family N-acetyltransferase [Saccharibacillus sp. O23]